MYTLNKEYYPYFQFKPAKNKSKGVIFFVHGYAVNSNYHNYFSDLVDDYDYYAVEHPGHGITPLKSKKQLKPIEYAKLVANLIKKLNLKNVILIGHSMGGGISTMVSQMIPNLIKKMILVTPMNSKGTTNVINFLFKFQPKNIDQIDRFYDILMYDYANNKQKVTQEEINQVIKLQNKYKKNFNKLKMNMASISNMLYLSKAEKNIPVPFMLIVGKHDDCINWKTTLKNFHKKNVNFKEYVFENAGHIPFLEQTKTYYQLLMDFINE